MSSQDELAAEWVGNYGTAMGWGSNDKHEATLGAWANLLVAMGVTRATLDAAYPLVLGTPVGDNWPGEKHWSNILSAVRAVKREESSRNSARDAIETGKARPYYCSVCCDCGFVSVPHQDCLDGSTWKANPDGLVKGPFYTQAVVCMCSRGCRQNEGKQTRVMTIEQYEQIVGRHWPRLLSWAADFRAQQARTAAANEASDHQGVTRRNTRPAPRQAVAQVEEVAGAVDGVLKRIPKR